jgi:hypothetical protein
VIYVFHSVSGTVELMRLFAEFDSLMRIETIVIVAIWRQHIALTKNDTPCWPLAAIYCLLFGSP